MDSAHDLRGTPRLVDPQVGHDIRPLRSFLRRDGRHEEEVGAAEVLEGMIDVLALITPISRRPSAASEAEKPLPNCAV